MWRSFWIDGRATPIIETSRASRKSAPQSTSRVPQARRVSLSLAPKEEMAVVLADTNQLLCAIVRRAPYLLVRRLSNKPRNKHAPRRTSPLHLEPRRCRRTDRAAGAVRPRAARDRAPARGVRAEVRSARAAGDEVDREPPLQDPARGRDRRRASAGHEQVPAPAARRARGAFPGAARLGAARDRRGRLEA